MLGILVLQRKSGKQILVILNHLFYAQFQFCLFGYTLGKMGVVVKEQALQSHTDSGGLG